MRLVETGTRWGNLYRFRYYINGGRVSKAQWEHTYNRLGLTPEDGTSTTISGGFRRIWDKQ